MKKILTAVLVFAIIVLTAAPSFAVAENSKLTYLYLDKGNIVIGDGKVTGYGYYGEKVTRYDSDGYFITTTTSSASTLTKTITFDGGQNYVVLNSININVQNYSKFTCALEITNAADVTLKSQGENTFLSGDSRAGIEISEDSSVTFVGDGSVMAGSNSESGIGGVNNRPAGKIIINSGMVVGQSRSNAAGIGGGSSGSSQYIEINGGNVIGKAATSGAGIGGGCTGDGGTIIINGGTVTASGGSNAAGIGGGWYGSMGDVIINGGSVKATGNGAPSVGSGAGAASDTILNSNGDVLYPVKIDTSSISSLKEIYTDGRANNIRAYHSNDKNFYFYLPADTHIIAVDSSAYNTKFFKVTYSGSFSSSVITPFECKNSASVQPDDIIRGISCGLKNLDNYITPADGFTLSYSTEIIGTGTKVYLNFNNNTVYSYTSLLYGDLDGDGFYDGEDSMIASFMLYGFLTADNTAEYLFEAADVNKDSYVDSYDIEILQQAGVLFSEIPQNEDGTVSLDSAQWDEYTLLIEQTPEQAVDNDSDFINEIIEFIMFIAEYVKKLIVSLVKV